MANPEHVKKLQEGVVAWNAWRRENPEIEPDFQEVNLHDISLPNVDLSEVNLSGANLSDAYLRSLDLSGADLSGANLTDAYISGVNFSAANFARANLTYTEIYKVDFSGANFSGATLVNASLFGAVLVDANFFRADLRLASLVKAKLNGATLTGAILYGTGRDDWSIKGVKCDYVHFDAEGQQRTPPDRDFEPGEFEKLHKAGHAFSYEFMNGMTDADPVIMSGVTEAIKRRHPEFGLRMTTIDVKGAYPKISFEVELPEHVEAAESAVREDYEKQLVVLEEQNKGQAAELQKHQARILGLEMVIEEYRARMDRALDRAGSGHTIHTDGGAVHLLGDGSSYTDSRTQIDLLTIENIAVNLELAAGRRLDDLPEESLSRQDGITIKGILKKALESLAADGLKEGAKKAAGLFKDEALKIATHPQVITAVNDIAAMILQKGG